MNAPTEERKTIEDPGLRGEIVADLGGTGRGQSEAHISPAVGRFPRGRDRTLSVYFTKEGDSPLLMLVATDKARELAVALFRQAAALEADLKANAPADEFHATFSARVADYNDCVHCCGERDVATLGGMIRLIRTRGALLRVERGGELFDHLVGHDSGILEFYSPVDGQTFGTLAHNGVMYHDFSLNYREEDGSITYNPRVAIVDGPDFTIVDTA